MITKETTYAEIERLVKSFNDILALLDEEIDKQVYVLYGLSSEEIAIIDGKE